MLADKAKDLLYDRPEDAAVINNPVAEVIEFTGKKDWENADIDWMNVWATGLRQMALLQRADTPIVISPSCGIDQLAVQAAWLGDQMQANAQALEVVSQEMMLEREAVFNRSGSCLQVILNSAEEEVHDCWDFIYALLPVASGISVAPDAVLTQYADFLLSVPAFRDVQRLPDNETSALDVLAGEVEKWKTHLDSLL